MNNQNIGAEPPVIHPIRARVASVEDFGSVIEILADPGVFDGCGNGDRSLHRGNARRDQFRFRHHPICGSPTTFTPFDSSTPATKRAPDEQT